MHKWLLLLVLLGCDKVDLMTSPLIISDRFSKEDRRLIEDATAEWVFATDGRFCPGGGDCQPEVGKVSTGSPFSVTEETIVWEGLRGANDTNAVHTFVKDDDGAVEYDYIALVRGHWDYRTVLHELAHRMNFDHGPNYENPDSPIMEAPGFAPECITQEDIEFFCRFWGCGGHNARATCQF